jgi:hypothetical protein
MGAEGQFPIRITTAYEGAGAKEANADLAQTTEQLKLGEHGYAEHQAAAQEAGRESVKAAEKTGLSMREEREIVRETGRAFGEQIPALRLWMNEATMGFAAAITVVELFKKGLENLEGPARRATELISALNAQGFKDAADAATNIATALGEIGDKEASLRAAFERGNTALDSRIKIFNDTKSAQIQIMELEEKAFEARMSFDSKEHPQNKLANDAAVENAKFQLARAKDQGDEAKQQNEIAERSVALAKAQFAIDFKVDENAVMAAQKKADAAKKAAGEAKLRAEAAEKVPVQEVVFGSLTAEEARNQLVRAQEQIEKDKTEAPQLIGSDQEAIDQLEKLLAAHQKALAPAQDAANQALVAQKHAESELASANALLETHQKLTIEGQSRIDQLKQELQLTQQIAAERQQSDTTQAQARLLTENADEVKNAVHHGEEAYKKITGGKGYTAADVHELIQMMRLLATAHTEEQAVGKELHAEVQLLKREVEAAQQKHNYGFSTGSQ